MKKLFFKGRIIIQTIFVILLFLGLHRTIHPVLIVFMPLALIAGNFFCGWICPLGTIQELLSKVGSLFIKRKIKMPGFIQRYAQYSKYLLFLAVLPLVLAGIIERSIPIDAYHSFYTFFDGDILTILAIVFLCLFLFISLFFDRPFCNYFCTNSIEYALPSFTRVFTVKRNKTLCVNCKICNKVCPMNIQVSSAEELRNIQCINCFQCIIRCPVPDALCYGKADNLLYKLKHRLKGNPLKNTPEGK